MDTNNLRKKIVDHVKRNQSYYGFALGVITMTAAYLIVINNEGNKAIRAWDEADERAREQLGPDAFAIQDRNGRIGLFVPGPDDEY